MGWTPDSQHVIFSGNEPGHSSRFYMQDVSGGAIRPSLPRVSARNSIPSPFRPTEDNLSPLTTRQARGMCAKSTTANALRSAASRTTTHPLRWSVDGKYIYASEQHPVSAVCRIELATGHRQLWKQLAPADPVGALEVLPSSITPDGKSYCRAIRPEPGSALHRRRRELTQG